MDEFAAGTGATGEAAPRRYLWTDAFAVGNSLELRRRTGNDRYLKLALDLVRQVHHVLGRHRTDDSRTGWISGLSEEMGERHPTAGGLRIGKRLNERGPNEPQNPRLEWEQDGQYFHYLTKWMQALCLMSRETGDAQFLRWGAELAAAAQRAFTVRGPGGAKRMVWKMSIDLTRPLVSSMGQHDPLDGLVTCLELQTSPGFSQTEVDLEPAVDDLTAMCDDGHWATDDPLGIGGLLDDVSRLAPIVFEHGLPRRDLLRRLLIETAHSLQALDTRSLLQPANHRLAFRELGLAIGMARMEGVSKVVTNDAELASIVELILRFSSLVERIRTFWSDPEHRRGQTWLDHQDINSVMLATSLLENH